MSKQPTISQQKFIETFAELINASLAGWPRQSGKTVARQLLCERIMEDDE